MLISYYLFLIIITRTAMKVLIKTAVYNYSTMQTFDVTLQ